ncbi:unnamed protein product, partial [Polarella glacialis]
SRATQKPLNMNDYNAAISACRKNKEWQLALSLLSTMTDLKLAAVPSPPAAKQVVGSLRWAF